MVSVTVLRDKKEKTCLLISIAITDDANFNTKENEELTRADRGQLVVESEDKNCASCNWNIRNN